MDFPQKTDSGIPLPIRAQAIAFDLDGTLLDYDGHLSETVERAVGAIARAGIKVFIATGRLDCTEYRARLGLDTPVATCNGAAVGFPGAKPLLHIPVSEAARDVILELDVKRGLYVNYYVGPRVYTLHDTSDRDYYSTHYSPVVLARTPDEIRRLGPPTKCLCVAAEEEQADVMRLFTDALGSEAVVTRSNTRFIEILNPGANKGVGVQALADWAGIPITNLIAVGDAMNDLPMLARAGFAITFKSGDPALAEHVDMILPPLWEDGMEVLAKCVLGLTNSGRFLTARSRRFFKD